MFWPTRSISGVPLHISKHLDILQLFRLYFCLYLYFSFWAQIRTICYYIILILLIYLLALRGGPAFYGFFLTIWREFLQVHRTTLKKKIEWRILGLDRIEGQSEEIMRAGWLIVDRQATSGSMAAPSRVAAALLCCLHDHVPQEIHGLWPHLFPGTGLGLWEDSMSGRSVNCWLY